MDSHIILSQNNSWKKCTVTKPRILINTLICLFPYWRETVMQWEKKRRNGIPSLNFKCSWIYMNKLHLLNVAIKDIHVFKVEWASNIVSFFFSSSTFYTLCFHKYLYFHDNKYCLCLMWFHIQYLLNVLKVRRAIVALLFNFSLFGFF